MSEVESTSIDQLKRHIEVVFRRFNRLEQPSLYDCYIIAAYGGGHGDTDRPTEECNDWLKVSDEYMLSYWHGLTYLNSGSFAYYLPRLMIFFLKANLEVHADMLDRFLFVLLEMVRGNNSDFLDILDASQVSATVTFLLAIRDQSCEQSIHRKIHKILGQIHGNQDAKANNVQ